MSTRACDNDFMSLPAKFADRFPLKVYIMKDGIKRSSGQVVLSKTLPADDVHHIDVAVCGENVVLRTGQSDEIVVEEYSSRDRPREEYLVRLEQVQGTVRVNSRPRGIGWFGRIWAPYPFCREYPRFKRRQAVCGG